MRGHAKFAIGLIIVGLLAMGGYKLAEPWLNAQAQKRTSDAADTKGRIKIQVDGWVGYFPLCSPEMESRLRRRGYMLECIDDQADYNARFGRLKNNEIDFAVATVDSYVLNGERFDYPGPIIAVIDQSKGGDALLAWEGSIQSLEVLKSKQNLKIAYTPNSPSHHLLKAIASHFDIPLVRAKASAVFADGSEDAYKRFLKKDVEAAVLWEPDVSSALEKDGVIKLLSTADTKGLIVDILIASREILQKKPEVVEMVLTEYFKTLLHYRNHQDELVAHIAKHYDIGKSQSSTLLNGVDWASLSDNARVWFGVDQDSSKSQQALVDSIDSAVNILLDHQDFSGNPLPQGDPYRLINSKVMQSVWSSADFALQGSVLGKDGSVEFKTLSEAEWERLQSVGTLKVRPIVFASGSEEITENGQEQIDRLIKDLKHYPHFRIEVRGHTGLRGDEDANIALSKSRAEQVLAYLRQHHDISQNRARAVGFGSSKPLPQMPGESYRAYNYRLPRVELVLLEEEI